jgi:hypothetical protein
MILLLFHGSCMSNTEKCHSMLKTKQKNHNPYAVVAKGVGDGPGPRTCRGLACLTPVLVCIKIAFSPFIVAVVCLTHVLLSETDNNEEGIEKNFVSFQIIKL